MLVHIALTEVLRRSRRIWVRALQEPNRLMRVIRPEERSDESATWSEWSEVKRRSRGGAKIQNIFLTLSKSKTSFAEIRIAFFTS